MKKENLRNDIKRIEMALLDLSEACDEEFMDLDIIAAVNSSYEIAVIAHNLMDREIKSERY